MKGLVITKPNKLELIDQKRVPLKEHELRIRVAVSAVCGSDLKLIHNPIRPGMQIPGHEFSGKVIESYSDKSFIGRRVTVFPMFSCLQCEHCNKREYRDCMNKKSLGYDLQGSFAEEVIVDERFTIRLLDKITYEEGALVEHLCCGFRLAIEAEKLLNKDAAILIVGDGPMALADLRFLLQRGYSNLTLIGKHQERMNCATKLGAKNVFFSDSFVHNTEYLQFFNAMIYTINREEIIEELLPSFKKQITIFPQARISDTRMTDLGKKYDVVFGRAFAYHIDDFGKVMELIQSEKLNVKDLISKKIPMKSIPDSVSTLFDKSKNKTLIINENFE